MFKLPTILVAGLIAFGLSGPALAQTHQSVDIQKQHWSFSGPFGKYDENQLQRGFQVFREVCSNCHSARLLAFRNLGEEGGPSFSEEQVKALAAEYEVADADVEGGKRKALPSDHWPDPFASVQDARDANGGALPPDLSVIAKARGVSDKFPDWLFNYFTTYSEGGPDYIHALLTGYADEPPEGAQVPEGKYYNHVFPGNAIGMPPPLSDGQVSYANADGAPVPETMLTADQYSQDVAAFLMWLAEPHLNGHKSAGFRVLAFLLLFAVLMWFVKQRLWRKAH